MGITHAEVLGYLPKGLDLSGFGSVWDAVGVIGFRLDCMVLMMMWLCVFINTHSISYRQVCGRITRYQYGTPDAITGRRLDTQWLLC